MDFCVMYASLLYFLHGLLSPVIGPIQARDLHIHSMLETQPLCKLSR